jgi:hypothetical protein
VQKRSKIEGVERSTFERKIEVDSRAQEDKLPHKLPVRTNNRKERQCGPILNLADSWRRLRRMANGEDHIGRSWIGEACPSNNGMVRKFVRTKAIRNQPHSYSSSVTLIPRELSNSVCGISHPSYRSRTLEKWSVLISRGQAKRKSPPRTVLPSPFQKCMSWFPGALTFSAEWAKLLMGPCWKPSGQLLPAAELAKKSSKLESSTRNLNLLDQIFEPKWKDQGPTHGPVKCCVAQRVGGIHVGASLDQDLHIGRAAVFCRQDPAE